MNAIEECLYQADYRQVGGRWRKAIGGHGVPLLDWEQAANDRGGTDFGLVNATNSRALLQQALEEWEYRLDEGEEWRRDWIATAKAALHV